MKRGFGTNFHTVYKNNADLYDVFSSSEIFSDKLTNRVRELFHGDILLDVACCTCHKTNLFSKYFKKAYALDISESLLSYARDKYKKNNKINYLLSSASKIPLLDNSVDTIFISWGSFPLSKTLKEMNRVLVPGGVIIRIGIEGRDNFTELFPNLDLKRVKRIQKKFESFGFFREDYTVDIKFDSIKQAQYILSRILGVNKKLVTSNSFINNVVLLYYKKQ